MSKEIKHALSKSEGLIPEFRFPEFEKDGEWVEKELGDEEVSRLVSNKVDVEKLTLTNYVSTDNMLPDYSGIAKASKLPTTDRVTEFIEGDILISNIRPYLKKVWKADRKGGASNDVLLFRSGSRVKSEFLEFILKNDAFINYVMQSARGVKMPRGDKNSMLEYPVRIPNPQEQQKIASCLSSLDELIAAHNDKLDALKDHKKGLMQNLFPQEGETVPKVRFREFKDDGEWMEKELGQISHNIMVGIASAATHAYRKSGIILFRNQNIKESYLDDSDILFIDEDYEKAHKNKRLKAGDLLTARTGYPGTTCVVPEKYEGSQSFTTLITRPDNSIADSDFLCLYINSEKGQAFFNSTKIGGGQKNVNAGSLKKMPIFFPSRQEQQKIASCLSAVDEIITAQTEKIEQLQQHKKGLMQGLFPKIV